MRLLLGILAAVAVLYVVLTSGLLHVGIGERATGGYDGAPSISPDQLDRAKQAARDAAAAAERAAGAE